jgi:CheY-like chemotaxis protein
VATAIESTSKGEVRIQARSWRDYGHVRFQVLVRGLDLHSENRERRPHKFYQTSVSDNQQSDRIGLQVAACTTLVEGMGGQIWLNRPGRGRGISVFFTLPLLTAQPLYWRRATDRERGFAIQGPPAGPLILLVEDEPKVIDKIARILNKHGYRTAFAVTADDGLEGARRLSPALVTIDLGLPVRPLGVLHSGLDLYQALQRDPRAASLPVILITGHDPTLTQPPQELPPILSKPFRAQQLLDQVANLLAGVNLWEVQG